MLALHIFEQCVMAAKSQGCIMSDLWGIWSSNYPLPGLSGIMWGGGGGGTRREAERTGGMIWSEFWHEVREYLRDVDKDRFVTRIGEQGKSVQVFRQK
jgi:hypothetical protein